MIKEELIKLFTDKETGKLNLPYGFVLSEPNKADETGIFQDKNNEWHVVKIGIPNPSGIGDAWYHRTLYCGYNEDNAFTVFFNFLIDKEDPNDWIINDKYEELGLNIFDSFIYLIKLEKDDSNEYLTRLESAKKND